MVFYLFYTWLKIITFISISALISKDLLYWLLLSHILHSPLLYSPCTSGVRSLETTFPGIWFQTRNGIEDSNWESVKKQQLDEIREAGRGRIYSSTLWRQLRLVRQWQTEQQRPSWGLWSTIRPQVGCTWQLPTVPWLLGRPPPSAFSSGLSYNFGSALFSGKQNFSLKILELAGMISVFLIEPWLI